SLEGFDLALVDLVGEFSLDVEGPLVVIANYVFDSLPVDAFAVKDGALAECLADGSRRPVTPYGDPDLDTLLELYRTTLDDTVFRLPVTALRAVRRLRELSGDRLLVLAAEKAFSTEEALGFRGEPELARHGSGAVSVMVNFHALGAYARGGGGEYLHGP